jgi:HSP20 family protein
MSRDLIHLMHALFLPTALSCREALWYPAVDVYRTRKGWLIKFELAGVRVQDIDLQVQGRVLTLRGVRRDRLADEGYTYHRMEIAYSQFERTLELPCPLERADVTSDYRDGMLLVRINLEATSDSPQR